MDNDDNYYNRISTPIDKKLSSCTDDRMNLIIEVSVLLKIKFFPIFEWEKIMKSNFFLYKCVNKSKNIHF